MSFQIAYLKDQLSWHFYTVLILVKRNNLVEKNKNQQPKIQQTKIAVTKI